jgi:hypothetical protein
MERYYILQKIKKINLFVSWVSISKPVIKNQSGKLKRQAAEFRLFFGEEIQLSSSARSPLRGAMPARLPACLPLQLARLTQHHHGFGDASVSWLWNRFGMKKAPWN